MLAGKTQASDASAATRDSTSTEVEAAALAEFMTIDVSRRTGMETQSLLKCVRVLDCAVVELLRAFCFLFYFPSLNLRDPPLDSQFVRKE